MRFRFVVDGPKYSKHKAAFKKILSMHGLAWRGSMADPLWAGPRERVRARFERDSARDITIAATLTWEGKAKTPLLNELKTWVFSLGGKEEKVALLHAGHGVENDLVDRAAQDDHQLFLGMNMMGKGRAGVHPEKAELGATAGNEPGMRSGHKLGERNIIEVIDSVRLH